MEPFPTKPVKLKPHTFNAAFRGRIRTALKAGVPWRSAAVAAGVSGGIFVKWYKRGQDIRTVIDSTSEYPEKMTPEDFGYLWLYDLIEELNAAVVVKHVKRIDKASKKSWAASAWWLERRAKEDFNKDLNAAAAQKKAEGASNVPQVLIELPDNGRSAAV